MKLSTVALLSLTLALGACAAQKHAGYYETGDSHYPNLAPEAPPVVPYQKKPWPPTDPWLVAWRPGHWSWNGASYSWVEGEYIRKPTPTAIWSGDFWEKRQYGWAFVPGTWR